MTKTAQTVAQRVFKTIRRNSAILEDRREYCKEDLQLAYRLTSDDAQELFEIIQKHFKA